MLNIITTIAITSALLLGGSIQTTAEDKPVAKPETSYFKTTGDSIESFKIEFNHPEKPDLSTPEGAFNAWVSITDERKEFSDSETKAAHAWSELRVKHLQTIEPKLLSGAALKDLAGDRKYKEEYRNSKKTSMYYTPIIITETKKLDDKTVQYLASNKEVYGEEEYPNLHRLTFKKAKDGKWLMSKAESGNYADEEKKEIEWYENYGILEFLYNRHGSVEYFKDIAKLKLDTPENAAITLFDYLFQKDKLIDATYHDIKLQPYISAIESLCTEEWQNELKKAAGWDDDGSGIESRKIESTKDGENGHKIVRLKPTNNWSGPLDIHLAKDGEVWKIVSIYSVKLPKGEKGKESRTKIDDLYAAQWK